MKKKFEMIILSAVLIFSSNGMGVYGNENIVGEDIVNCTQTNAPNLRKDESEEKDNVLLEKLQCDKENNVTELPEEIEEELNEVGLFDEEIGKLDKDTKENLQEATSISVSINYYSVNDKTGIKKEMSEKEIEETIEKKVEEGDIVIENNNENILDTILTKIGIKPIEVKGASKSAEDTGVSPSKALKQYMICSQTSKKGKIFVTYTATWLDEAYYRNKDVLGVNLTNAAINKSSVKCDHWVDYERYTLTSKTKKKMHTKPTTKIWGDGGNGVAFIVNLFGDRADIKLGNMVHERQYYKNEYITIRFSCNVENRNNKYVKLTSKYSHLETSKSLSPSVSFSSGGFSVSVSGSSKNYYHTIANNAYIKYKYI